MRQFFRDRGAIMNKVREHRPEQPRPDRRGQPRRPPGRRPRERRGATGTPSRFGEGGALRRAPVYPTPYPSGARVRRFWAILWPVDAPKCHRGRPETGLRAPRSENGRRRTGSRRRRPLPARQILRPLQQDTAALDQVGQGILGLHDPATRLWPSKPSRREIERFENAIGGMNDAVVEEPDDLNGTASRSPDSSSVGRSPLPIRKCAFDIGGLVQGNRARACELGTPQVAGQLGVAPRPADRRCRSASPGRGRERPRPLVCLVRHRGGAACACPCRPPRRVAP